MPQYAVTVRSKRTVLFMAEVQVDAPDPGTARRLATEKAANDSAEPDWAAGEEVEQEHSVGPEDVREVHCPAPTTRV
jgi:hypothetical protein